MKAVNWALRQVGKRNRRLNKAAVAATRRIEKQGSRSARWIARDALRELVSETVRLRLGATAPARPAEVAASAAPHLQVGPTGLPVGRGAYS